MLALATSAAFQGYLQGGLASRMTESRVGSVRMDDSWRRTYNGKPPGTTQGLWSSSGSGAATAAPALRLGKQDFSRLTLLGPVEHPGEHYKNKAPFTAKVISVKRIVGPQATGETCNIVMRTRARCPTGGPVPCDPAGENPKKPGKPNTVRLYSIASSRYGDDMTGTTTTLCVRPPMVPRAQGGRSRQEGHLLQLPVRLEGRRARAHRPFGKVMPIPKDPNVDLIMVATGTGIAPHKLHPPLRREDPVRRGAGPGFRALPRVANTDASFTMTSGSRSSRST